MNALERFCATMNYQQRDHAPFKEFLWPAWPETSQRWAAEGGYDAATTDFGCDRWVVEYSWFMPEPPFEKKIIEEDEKYITYVDPQGIIVKEFKNNPKSSIPEFVRFPVEDRKDFRKFWQERMQPDIERRLGPYWKEKLSYHRHRDYPLIVIGDQWGGFFGALRNLVGVERLCMLFYDDPTFVEEMIESVAEFLIALLSQILKETDIDVFGFWEDMAYRNASLISPELVRKFMLPGYRKVVDFARDRGVRFFSLDSDGYIDSLIPIWMEAGIDIIYPFEVQACMDVIATRKKYGRRLRMWGGVDKRVLRKGEIDIDAELERLKPLIDDGGYVPMLDHSAPPDISYRNYCYFLERLRNIL